MLRQDKRKIIIPMIALGTAALGATMFPETGFAQSLFGQNSNYRYGPSPFELGLMRTAIILGSTAIGFALGWAMSPQAKEMRKGIAAIAAIAALITVFVNNGALGWSLAILVATIGFFAGLGFWLSKTLQSLGEVPTTFGSASWAQADELIAKNIFGTDGFRLGRAFDGESERPISYKGDRHLLTVAPARTGKGTTQIVPNLLTYEGSCVVIDPKGENAMMTAQARRDMGQEVHLLDPFNIANIEGFEPSCFNPMDWLNPGDPEMTENAMILGDAQIIPTGSNDSFWDEEAKAFNLGIDLYVATDEREAGQRHLGRARDLMLLDGDDMKMLFERMLESPHHIVASTGARALQKDEKLLSNVLASLQAQTHFLDSAAIRESMSASDFRFEDLKTKPMTVYLILPADRLNAFSRWLRLMIQQAITVNARNIAEKPEKPVLFILDEMAALGRLTMVEHAYGLMAGFGMQLHGIVQDLSQLKRIYGDGWETFVGNSGVIQYFGSRDRMSAEYFSALCGDTTVWSLSSALSKTFGNSSGGGGLSSSESSSSSDTRAASHRKLAYPDELMRLHEGKQLLFIENMNPIIATKVPWFLDDELKHRGVSLQ